MIKIVGVYTERNYITWPSYHIVYEWEDIISDYFKIPLINIDWKTRIYLKIIKLFNIKWLFDLINEFIKSDKYYLYYVMSAANSYLLAQKREIIPIIIDFYLKKEDLDSFYRKFRSSKCLLVSSLEVVSFLKANNCPIPIYHFPISLPDQYQFDNFTKNHQILLTGRQSPVLKNYLLEYLNEFPDTEYVYESNQGKFKYISNKQGVLGIFSNRNRFNELLRSSRISFYNTPGIDDVNNRANGYNQVTPKFLELLAANVKIIARYPVNEETEYFELNKACSNIENYRMFKSVLTEFLNNTEEQYSKTEYLAKHYTSQRMIELNKILISIK